MKRQFGRSTRRFHGMERLHEVVEEEYGKGYRKENRRVEKEERKNKLMKSKKKKKKNERDGWIVREGRRGVESVQLLREDINNVRTLGEDNSKVKISCCKKMKNRIDGSDEDDEEDEGEEDESDDDDDGDNDGEKNEEKRKEDEEDEEDEGDEEEDVVGGDDDDGEEGNDDGNETIDLKDGYQGYEVKKKELRNGEQANKRFFHRLQALNN